MKQFLMFAGVGAIGTLGHYLCMIVLVELFAVNPVIATTAGFITGAIINYLLNYRYTFRSDKAHSEAFSKFFTIAIIGAIFNSILMQLGTHYTAYNYIFIQVFSTALILLWNFFANKFWTFSSRKTECAQQD